MIEGNSLREIAEKLGIALRTAFAWHHKILNAFKRIGCHKLEGITEIDETFFLYSEKGNKHIENRPARKRGGTAKKRGISNEQVAVITSCDRQNNLVIDIACLGRISEKNIEEIIGGYIDTSNTLCSDEHNGVIIANGGLSLDMEQKTTNFQITR